MLNRHNSNRADQELDRESKAGLRNLQDNDKEIDAGIDAISSAVDRLGNLASNIKQEVIFIVCLHTLISSLLISILLIMANGQL